MTQEGYHSRLRAWDGLRELLAKSALRAGPARPADVRYAGYHFDCTRVTLTPDGADLVADAFLEKIEALGECPDAIGGATPGADTILGPVMMRAFERGRWYTTFYVRSEPKSHGTQFWIDNPPAAGSKVVIVADVVTDGHSTLSAVGQATLGGCEVAAVIALIDCEQDGAQVIRARCAQYIPLFRLCDFPEVETVRARGEHACR
jgi:orotate phosphoribosyltransferase